MHEHPAVPRVPAPRWSASSLSRYAQHLLGGRQLVVVSQRQPIVYTRQAGGIEARVPAGGLVSAVLPMIQACGGTWVGESTGDGDASVVDAQGCVQVAGAGPGWTARLLRLPQALRRAHNDGFSNGGLWPACHNAPTAARFELTDWRAYRHVNALFADAVCAAIARADAVVHVHDYHLCLVPGLMRARAPRSTIVHYWHIPWPLLAELRVCPWHPELVRGLAAADAVVFQTREDAGRFEHACAALGVRPRAAVRAVPISIAWPAASEARDAAAASTAQGGVDVADALGAAGLPAAGGMPRVVLGVDRFDYAKGLVERLAGFERLLESQPQWRGAVTLLQVAAPTREAVPAYRAYRARVLQRVADINARFGRPGWQPVQWRTSTHAAHELEALYRSADVCLVTSLQDGMNLVCKEYAAARDDESGCLVLSRRAGASRELKAALLVEPRDADDIAAALHRALCMSPQEQRQRMRQLRAVVRNFNVHRWAARLLAAGQAAVLGRQAPDRLRPRSQSFAKAA